MIHEIKRSQVKATESITGPDWKQLETPVINAPKEFSTYTVGIMWDEMTQAMLARILRDMFTLERICTVQRAHLVVACNSEILDKMLAYLHIKRTPIEGAADYWRLYYVKNIPIAPEDAELVEEIQVSQGAEDPQMLHRDPNFPETVDYQTYTITDTVPLYKAPPKGPADWAGQQFF